MSAPMVPVDLVLTPAQAWCRVTGKSMRELGKTLGHSPSHFYRITDLDKVSRPVAESILSGLVAVWPKSHVLPAMLRTWAEAHPDLVRAAKSKLEADQPKMRKCLCCPSQFLSEGPHNRMCAVCRYRVGGLPRQMVG